MIKKLQLSKLFWIALATCYAFGMLIVYAFLTTSESLFDVNNAEHMLTAFKLTYIRSMVIMLVLAAYPIILLRSRKYITFLTVGLTAWVIAMYIDDNLVLYKIIEYPNRGLVVFLQMFRPIVIVCLVWMSFELTFSNNKKYDHDA